MKNSLNPSLNNTRNTYLKEKANQCLRICLYIKQKAANNAC